VTSIIKRKPSIDRYDLEIRTRRARTATRGQERGAVQFDSIDLALLILLVQVLVAGQSVADWKVYVVPGLGISSASVETDGLVSGLPVSLAGNDDDSAPLDFAWNAGMGFNYALTKNVGVSVGYRYVGIGTQKVTAVGPTTVGPLEYDPQLHEFRVGIRIRVFEFFSPWR
jgi:opacity protein-like surface antigen